MQTEMGLLQICSKAYLGEKITGTWLVWHENEWQESPDLRLVPSQAYVACRQTLELWCGGTYSVQKAVGAEKGVEIAGGEDAQSTVAEETSGEKVMEVATVEATSEELEVQGADQEGEEDFPQRLVKEGKYCILGGANTAGVAPWSQINDGCLDLIIVESENASRIDLLKSYSQIISGQSAEQPVYYIKASALQIVPFAERGSFEIDGTVSPGSPIELRCYQQVALFTAGISVGTRCRYHEAVPLWTLWKLWATETRALRLRECSAWDISCRTTLRCHLGRWRTTASRLICVCHDHRVACESYDKHHTKNCFTNWASWNRLQYDQRCALSMARRLTLTHTWSSLQKHYQCCQKVYAAGRIEAHAPILRNACEFRSCVQSFRFNFLAHFDFRQAFEHCSTDGCLMQAYTAKLGGLSQVKRLGSQAFIGNFTVCWPVGLSVFEDPRVGHELCHLECGANVGIWSIKIVRCGVEGNEDGVSSEHIMGQTDLGWIKMTTSSGIPCVLLRKLHR